MAHYGLVLLVFELRELVEDVHLFQLVGNVKGLVTPEIRKLALKDHFQANNFLLILPQKSIFGVLVYDGLVLDEFSPA